MSDILSALFDAQIDIAGYPLLWREIIGNVFGFASAVGGLRRRVWAWPVGIVGNVILFTVFFGVAVMSSEGRHPLYGQAFRQVFFVITSVYGWWRWQQSRRTRAKGEPAITPRWATAGERTAYLLGALVLVLVCQWIFAQVGAGWPAPRWYYWTDAWIFVGSILATFAMARGWVDFWLVWIAVDLVGVPLLWHSGYYPSAIMYAMYGGFVLWGFVVWRKAARDEAPEPAITGAGPVAEGAEDVRW